MAKILLGATGSVAAVRTPTLFAALRAAGHDVRVVATTASLYFFDPLELDPGSTARNPAIVSVDADEWPGRDDGARWERGDAVLHIELRRWADLFLIAPLDANTLTKIALGLCDNCLTCVWRAWDTSKPVVLAPAMNSLMWEHPHTKRYLRQLGSDFGASHVPGHLDTPTTIDAINERSPRLRIVAPVEKTLACGDVGIGAMAEVSAIVECVGAMATG